MLAVLLSCRLRSRDGGATVLRVWDVRGSSRHRLLTRTGNDYGRDAAELAEQLELNRLAGSARWGPGWITVDATRPVEEVADDIVRLTLGPV